ncbi:hypothetical protein [Bradyrhizobium sp.]|uniref:hypothetical protein n=1 Tax=Bradyrhizobium sp. TaxID=376 RepID=UPI003C1B9D9D
MKYLAPLVLSILVLCVRPGLAATVAAASETKGKTCRMEQQCHWDNFKKICVYVKVCR